MIASYDYFMPIINFLQKFEEFMKIFLFAISSKITSEDEDVTLFMISYYVLHFF